MYKYVCNIPKYVRTYARLGYTVANTCESNLRSNKFANRLPKFAVIERHRHNYNRRSHRQKMSGAFVLSNGILYALLDYFRPDEDKIPELIKTLKRSILLIQKGEFQKAERMLHIALREAQTLQNYDAVTYVYDVMANLALDTKNYNKAKTLFTAVLQRLLSNNVPEDDLRVIHISLKMAKILEETGDIITAETGYQYCINCLEKHISVDNKDENALELLGMTSDWYAQMLFKQDRYAECLSYYSQALDLYLKVHDRNEEQTVILLNGLGTVACMLEQYDKAMEYLSTALEIAKELPEKIDIGYVHVNMGHVYLKKKLYEEARRYCKKGWKLAKDQDNSNAVKEAEVCLDEIKKAMD